MPIPHLPQVRIALWEELEKAGRTGEARDIIEKLAQRFQLTQTEREQRDPAGNKTFDHRVHSAVAQSRIVGWIEPVEASGRNIWTLTSVYFEDMPLHSQEKIEEELQKRFKAVDDAMDAVKEFALGLIPKED